MSNLTILAFGNFQEKDSSETLIDNFLKNQNVLNVEKKRNNSITFPYNLTENDPTLIKIIFIKNFEKEHKICKLANGYILLIDLEQVDCLDKLNDISQYIKLKCNSDTINTFIIGKYNDLNNKIQSLNKNVIDNQIKKIKIMYSYHEICLNPFQNFINLFEAILKDILENKTNKEKKIGKPNETASKCIIY
jgi:hypothetical protein